MSQPMKEAHENMKPGNVPPSFTQPDFSKPMPNQKRVWYPYSSPFDPCPPIKEKVYETPPQLFIPFQPMGLPQYSPREALKKGVLWPFLFSPYESKLKTKAHKL